MDAEYIKLHNTYYYTTYLERDLFLWLMRLCRLTSPKFAEQAGKLETQGRADVGQPSTGRRPSSSANLRLFLSRLCTDPMKLPTAWGIIRFTQSLLI